MSDLISILQAQHAAVGELAKKVGSAVGSGDVDAVVSHLKSLRGALVAHLALEDQELYPSLQRNTLDPTWQALAKSFSANMGRITQGLLSFLSKYESGIALLPEFEKDWTGILSILKLRIAQEETVLYPLYTKLLNEPRARSEAQKS